MSKTKKEKKPLKLGDILKYTFFILSVCTVPIYYFFFHQDTPHATIYCNEDNNCYTYENHILKRYEKEWIRKESSNKKGNVRYIEKESCHVEEDLKNDCNLDIKEITSNKILIQNKNIITHYYNEKYKYTKVTNNQLILNRTYQNGKNELYFLNENEMIISSEKGYQRKYKYSLSSYDDEYYTINLNGTASYTYNYKTNEIIGYKETSLEGLQYILLDYYEEDGSIKMKNDYLISGSFFIQTEEEKKDLYIYKNKVLIGTEKETLQQELKVIDVNEHQIFFSFGEDTPLFSYDIDEKQLKSEGIGERVITTTKDKLKQINFDFYNEDTTFKPIDIPYEGAYRYEEEISEKEILIKNGKILLREYYPRNPEYKKQEEYTYTPKKRNEKEIEFSYDNGEKTFRYDIEKKTIQIYELEYKKIEESDLKYINKKKES